MLLDLLDHVMSSFACWFTESIEPSMNKRCRTYCVRATFLASVAFLGPGLTTTAFGQTRPVSMDFSPGVHVYAYDGLEHKSEEHYTNLCKVVLKEFNLHADSISIMLVFLDSALQERLIKNNPARFQAAQWYGVCIKPALILMAGEDESDDTFMHEFMHSLYHRGLIFRNVQPAEIHPLIDMNEGLLLGSKSYLEYLKTRPR
jgi:hypothetical protein